MLKRITHFFSQEIPVTERPPRLPELDAARGLAIIFVVIGHIISKGEVPADNNWFVVLMGMIYQFHMPFFMALAGITFALSLPVFGSWGEIRAYSVKRVKPLMVPFVILGLVIVVGKLVAVHFLEVSNPPGSLGYSLLMLLFDPTESAVRFLWFIYVLSMYLILIPPLFHIAGRRPVLLLMVAIVLQFFDWPEELALRAAVEYLPFFALGMVLWIYRAWWTPVAGWAVWSGLAVFIGLLIYSDGHTMPRWVTGAASIVPLIGLVQQMPVLLEKFFGYLGQKSLSIYLFNVPVMGLVKGVLFLILPWDGPYFFFYFPVLVVTGTGIPLTIKVLATKWLPRVAKFI
ncbi:MAG TPA: acyltransferase [Verrucomicrobiae bacterium]|nr:acyltransferase [Verrucomicrobiae bacterium]